MITINGKVYDGVAVKPDLDDALEHYGVKGMKWRKHLKVALSKASRYANKVKSRASRTAKKFLNTADKYITEYADKDANRSKNSRIGKFIENDSDKIANRLKNSRIGKFIENTPDELFSRKKKKK